MKILTRFEGGLGDCLLANRFLHAIKEKYPYDEIRVLFDTDDNPIQETSMKELWPSLYNNTMTLPPKKNKLYKITSNLGPEIWPACINNLPDIFFKELDGLSKHDIFYDLHIDGLKWINYDFDWKRYYYYFPKPEKIPPYNKNLPKKFIFMHLYARPDAASNTEKDYALSLIEETSKILPVVIACEKKYYDYYKGSNAILTDATWTELFDISSKCEMFIGIDSSVRFIPYHFSKPTFVLSRYCTKYKQVHPAKLIKWLIFEKDVLPINCDINHITIIIKNILNNKAYSLFPDIKNNIENYIYQRYINENIK